MLNALQAVLAAGREIYWDFSGGKGWHLNEGMVGNRVSSSVQAGLLGAGCLVQGKRQQ